jgi:23S rRNA pseudouridine1911/1915/1917 synthase
VSLTPPPDCDRFDPPVRRLEWRTTRTEPFSGLVARLRTLLPADAVERLLRHRGLQLDGRPTGGERVPEAIPGNTRVVAWVLEREPEPIAIAAEHVLLDEAGVVAVAKPAWLPVQGTRASQDFSLERALQALLHCPGLRAVHRLDRETSGVVLFARDTAAASFLGRALAARSVRRRYLAVVAPPPAARFDVSGALARVADPRRFRFGLQAAEGEGARMSHTRFVRLAVRGDRALLYAEPTTGRTHQIRVHLAAQGAPILGDRLYGDAATPGAARCLLHAERVALALPGPSGRRVSVETAPPADFAAAGFPPGE